MFLRNGVPLQVSGYSSARLDCCQSRFRLTFILFFQRRRKKRRGREGGRERGKCRKADTSTSAEAMRDAGDCSVNSYAQGHIIRVVA